MTACPAGSRILLIEDQGAVCEVLALMLALHGYTVLQAPGGREGLARLEAGETVDLVLTDLHMPGMSGWEVVRAVKAGWPHLPVGLITGSPNLLPDHPLPVDLVIPKPVTLEELLEAIDRALVVRRPETHRTASG